MADVIQKQIYEAYALAALDKLAAAGLTSPSEEAIVKTAAKLIDADVLAAEQHRKVAMLDSMGRELAHIYVQSPDAFPKLAALNFGRLFERAGEIARKGVEKVRGAYRDYKASRPIKAQPMSREERLALPAGQAVRAEQSGTRLTEEQLKALQEHLYKTEAENTHFQNLARQAQESKARQVAKTETVEKATETAEKTKTIPRGWEKDYARMKRRYHGLRERGGAGRFQALSRTLRHDPTGRGLVRGTIGGLTVGGAGTYAATRDYGNS